MNPFVILATLLIGSALSVQSILVQPHNYMLDDSGLMGHQQTDGGSLSPFYNDQAGSSEQAADKDIVSAIGQGLERLRFGRANFVNGNTNSNNQEDSEPSLSHFSAEMAELIQSEQQHQAKQGEPGSLSASMAHVLMNVAQAAAEASSGISEEQQNNEAPARDSQNGGASILELDTSGAPTSSIPTKSDLKSGPIQWYNPKETIPVLKISSMATPSKYKKVYFRSEKKLVDGAFHSPANDKDEKRSLKKAFISGVQRRSSRGTSSSVAPPGILQDGLIEFMKKFRDVYVQTRQTGASVSAPFASSSSSSASSSSFPKPSLASAVSILSAVASRVNSASSLAQATNPSSSPTSSNLASAASNTVNTVVSATGSTASGATSSPFSAQTYMSFWSKTFPAWVRKMLKQMRRRSLQNSSKRQKQHSHHSHSNTIGHAAQAAANVATAVEHATSGGSSSSSGH